MELEDQFIHQKPVAMSLIGAASHKSIQRALGLTHVVLEYLELLDGLVPIPLQPYVILQHSMYPGA